MTCCHLTAFMAGFLLDIMFGDPHWLFHPVRLIGWLIAIFEKLLYRGKRKMLMGGILVVLVVVLTLLIFGGILIGAYFMNPFLGIAVESIMTYQLLAIKSLKTESMKVYDCLTELESEGEPDKVTSLEQARRAVSMIVGRDTENLDEQGIVRAAVETVAENTSDGVVAPMLYLFVGGPILGFLYKAVNTMDSMIGYQNERYLYFGRIAARFDDVLNVIPSRISAWLMIFASFVLGKDFNGRTAYRIYWRDRKKSKSPNSAQTESVCAGALGVRLLGDAVYFGKIVRKPYIGDEKRGIEKEDIRRANCLMYMTAILCEAFCILFLFVSSYFF